MGVNYYNERKKAGLCSQCGNALDRRGALCIVCLEKRRTKARHRKHKGECVWCGSQTASGLTCDGCKAKKNARTRLRKEKGLCKDCNNLRCIGCYCETCANKHKKSRDLFLSNRRDSITCRCGKNKLAGPWACEECILKRVAKSLWEDMSRWRELLGLYQKQDGLCNYTGLHITIGVDAEVDHIVPRSKNGQNQIENLQWIHKNANRMKSNLDAKTFLKFVELVYNKSIKLED